LFLFLIKSQRHRHSVSELVLFGLVQMDNFLRANFPKFILNWNSFESSLLRPKWWRRRRRRRRRSKRKED